jgi:3,4-dihydroxyphenylacetate 2,3-dioxygenase
MGEVVGVGLVSHVPTIMFSEELRRELNEGREISFVPGYALLRSEVFDRLQADTVVIFDSHWFTTVEHVVSAHERRSGIFTSSELPRGMSQIPYDYPGDPELGRMIATCGEALGTPMHASDDPYLPVYYATTNVVHFLQKDEAFVSVSVAQTGEADDFLTVGEAVGEAVRRTGDRRVILLASGGMSHRFWRLKEIAKHEASDPVHIITPEARAADLQRIEWMKQGDHAAIIDSMDEYDRHLPEAGFGHYLMMVGAVGGRECTARGVPYSDYENATGTGQVHVWFDRPAGGWTA